MLSPQYKNESRTQHQLTAHRHLPMGPIHEMRRYENMQMYSFDSKVQCTLCHTCTFGTNSTNSKSETESVWFIDTEQNKVLTVHRHLFPRGQSTK